LVTPLSGARRSFVAFFVVLSGTIAAQEPPGSVRGSVRDKDFDAPLPAATIAIVELGLKVVADDQGAYVFKEVPPGRYTLLFSKDGYVKAVRSDVLVASAKLAEVDASLAGEFTDMEEFVVQDALKLAPGGEAALLKLRLDNPALLDSIGADLLSRAGASDAASALRLVAGATVQDGKSAVVRGLPDRYVSSQVNGVRLPSADEDKRAVELDQFPSVVIESVRVTKTFTPDQQGDASGGAVDIRLKGIPTEPFFIKLKVQTGFNSQAAGEDRFLNYAGGGVNFLGFDDGGRDIQVDNLGMNWTGAVGVSEGAPPLDYKWQLSSGISEDIGDGWRAGGSINLFYERSATYFDDGREDAYWVETPGAAPTPQYFQGTPFDGDFRTGLFDVRQGTLGIQWGALAVVGVENENHAFNLAYLYSRTVEDKATLAEDVRGKELFFPGFDPYDPTTPGHEAPDAAPYLRLETLEYTERATGTWQLSGRHTFPFESFALGEIAAFNRVEADWTFARSFAELNQPDKRQFSSAWFPERQVFPGFVIPAHYRPYLPAANFNLGNLQRIWKTIEEDATQLALNVKLPFRAWNEEEGWFKVGVFNDSVDRAFDQDSFSNFADAGATYQGNFDQPWSAVWSTQNHPITASTSYVDYEGELDVSAWYAMLSLPITKELRATGGFRFESTTLSIVNDAEQDATWFPPGATAPTVLNPGDADVAFEESDVLPSFGLEYKPVEGLTLRGAFNETIARQTFKEITPILQQEFLGGPVFIGNPALGTSAVKNYDLRVDYVPEEGTFLSASWFKKDIEDPIEYVQKVGLFSYTTAVNYPEGTLSGVEFEARQEMGALWEPLAGLSAGANATLISSEVTLPADEVAVFAQPNIGLAFTTRDMTNAPEHLFNFYLTYDVPDWGTRLGLFYTIQGDTLVEGAGEKSGNFIPSVYAKSFDTLNFTLSQKLDENISIEFQAKNLTNPSIERVYRHDSLSSDVLRSSFTRGVEFTIALVGEFKF
jgi:outer membrane receptor protein involved in Fe transport